jgi:hypothetical protein
MPSLKELFKTHPLSTQNGKVGAEAYDIRNSKDIPISTSNSILNTTVFPLVQKTLRGSSTLTARTKETLIEEELVGLRAISKLSSPVLYGTEIIRISQRTTPILEIMKMGANGTPSDGSAFISNIINKGTQGINNFLQNKLGVQFPTKLIPTSVSETMISSRYASPLTPAQLADIQNDGAGNIVGKFIQQNVQGTPSQIGRATIGDIQRKIKSKIRNEFFREINLVDNPIVGKALETSNLRNDFSGYNSIDTYSSKLKKYNNNLGLDESTDLARILNDIQTGQENEFVNLRKTKDIDFADTNSVISDGRFPTFTEFSLDMLTQNIPGKRTKTKYSNTSNIVNNRIEARLDITNGSDRLNREVAWYSEDGTPPTNANDKTLDDYSMIPLRFYSISKKSGVSFRAVIDGLSETFSPSWESSKFIGNPYSFYTYNGIDRSISFNFKIFSLNMEEHKSMWQKVSFLTTMVYPQQFATPYITPPFIKFTLGDMYNNKEAFIESLSYTVDDNTPWELGYQHNDSRGNAITDTSLKNYKLPTIISVQITLKFIETQSTHWSKNIDGSSLVNTPNRMYDYGSPSNRGVITISEKRKNINPDGSAINIKVNPIPTIPSRSFDTLPNNDIIKNATKNLKPNIQKGETDVVLGSVSSRRQSLLSNDGLTNIRNATSNLSIIGR